jgi:hypothetical protein
MPPRLPRRPKLPLPLLARDDTAQLDVGTVLWRVYFAGGPFGTSWAAFRSYGPVLNGRFDHHRLPSTYDPDRRVMYAGVRIPGCLAEAYSRTRQIDRWTDDPYLVAFRLAKPVTLLDLRGSWPTRAGGSQAISTGPHSVGQAWSRAIYDSYADVDGLQYVASMAGSPDTNVALYERGEGALPPYPLLNIPLSHRGLDTALRHAASRFGYDLR